MTDAHLGKTYSLNGPDVLSGSAVASIWSALLGKQIKYTGEDMDAFEVNMREKAPAWSAFDVRMMFKATWNGVSLLKQETSSPWKDSCDMRPGGMRTLHARPHEQGEYESAETMSP